MKKIRIKINGQAVECAAGDTIMKAAYGIGIKIPGLCGHPDFPPKANCRLCVVEIKDRKKLATACSTKAEAGMEIRTDTERVRKARNINLELIFAEHIEKCPTCVWRYNCRLLEYAEKYKIEITRFRDRKKNRKVYKFANAVEIDGRQCIDCRNCLDACSLLQKINYLELKGKGADQEVVPVKNKKIDCIYCGQCAVHCPVSAAQEQTSWREVEKILTDAKKTVVAQFAPSIRVSIGEEFGLPYGEAATGQVVAGLRKLGFKRVFDVSFGADMTTMAEAEELLERIKDKGKLPLFTACCPAWVKYAEFYHPELIPNLTAVRSPHIQSGGAIKTWWAEKTGTNPKDIAVVSVMPCTAKKFEAARKELKIEGLAPVDYVLTAREFAFMLKEKKIDLAELKPAKADDLLGDYSGAGVIYGASGGVMESALRTAQYLACKNKKKNSLCKTRLEFKDVRGLAGLKETIVEAGGRNVRVAVVNGIGNLEPVLKNLTDYDYVEVMACPGGCIGGGGQPIPTTPFIRQKRLEALYQLDKVKRIRKAHENKAMLEILKWLGKEEKLKKQVLYTSYLKRC